MPCAARSRCCSPGSASGRSSGCGGRPISSRGSMRALPPRRCRSGRSVAFAGKDAEYLKVRATGRFDHGKETLVDALTERGKGYWVLTPLRTADRTLLVNRGFVPSDRAKPATRATGQVGGRGDGHRPHSPDRARRPLPSRQPAGRGPLVFARRRRHRRAPAASRRVAPFFIDADAAPNPGGLPIGGLTVVRFRNSHLVYALTWFALVGAEPVRAGADLEKHAQAGVMDVPLLALTRSPVRLPGRSPRDAVVENMRLLVQLRWIAVAGQVLAILVAHYLLGVVLPFEAMLSIAGLLALGNLLFTVTLREAWVVPRRAVAGAAARHGRADRPALSQRRHPQSIHLALPVADRARRHPAARQPRLAAGAGLDRRLLPSSPSITCRSIFRRSLPTRSTWR